MDIVESLDEFRRMVAEAKAAAAKVEPLAEAFKKQVRDLRCQLEEYKVRVFKLEAAVLGPDDWPDVFRHRPPGKRYRMVDPERLKKLEAVAMAARLFDRQAAEWDEVEKALNELDETEK